MIEVNWIGILLSAVAAMVVGFVYYSPYVAGKPWMKLMGITPDNIKQRQSEMMKLYGISFVLALVTAFVLSHVITMSQTYFPEYTRLTSGIMSAFWMWLGFVMPVQLTDVLFGGKVLKLFAINTGYQLITLLVMGLILALVV
jgi:hypothetical protein